MKNAVLPRLLPLVAGVLLGLALCEMVVRLGGRVDEDGGFSFRGWRLKPYRLPVQRARELVRLYVTRRDRVATYDPDLGWTVFPHSRSPSGIYAYNRDGLRTADREASYSPTPAPGVLRIELFGDSFANGADVPFAQTWGQVLEAELRRRGIAAEVLNFGVGGYGMDQALLRWRKQGRRLSPRVVLLGFQPENVKRNVNLVRLMYVPDSRLPFTKPRFVSSGDTLRAVNVPAAPPESLPAIIEHMDRWPLRRHEAFYRPDDYRPRLPLASRFVAFALAVLGRRVGADAAFEAAFGRTDSEAGVVTLRVVDAFERDARAAGAEFLLVHLPAREGLAELRSPRRALPYAELLAALQRGHRFVETGNALLAGAASLDSLFGPTSHYSALGNRIVGEVVADSLARLAGPR